MVSVILSSVEAAVSEPAEVSPPSEKTIDSAPKSSPVARLYAIATRFGARLERLADVSIAAAIAGSGTATDQAAVAARCALAIREELPDARIVLATGLGMVNQRLAMGVAIDRAATMLRARSSEHPGAKADPPRASPHRRPIRLDEATSGLLDTRFEIGGDDRGLELYREREPMEPSRTLLGRQTVCVGRERELSILQGLFDECLSEPVSRAVLITAPAGLGKSRILHEFLEKLRVRASPAIWIARGDPMRAGSRFGLLAQALRRELGLDEGQPASVRQQKIRARVARHNVHEPGRVSQFLGELLSVPFPDGDVELLAARRDPALMRDQIDRAWRAFLSDECSAHPVVLVLDDVQWGDLPSLKLIDEALRNLSELPLMIVALARPEVHQLFPELWQARGVTEIRLSELTRKAGEKLVRQVLGDSVSAEDVERLVRQASGNAFHLEELIRAVASGNRNELPETVLAMAQARIEGLEVESRRVLRAASAFGQVFWAEGIAPMLGGAERMAEIARCLRELCEGEVIALRPSGRFPGETEYHFRHALVREAAYSTLTDHDRTLAHRRAAQWLEKSGETDPFVLAEHFDRGQDPKAAARWYRQAAAEALAGNDVAAALAAAGRGIESANKAQCEDELGALFLTQASAQVCSGELASAGQSAEQALSRVRRGAVAWFRALIELIVSSGRLAHTEELRDWVRVAAAATPEPEAKPAQTACLCRGVTALLIAGRFEDASALLDRVEAIVPDLDSSDAGTLAQVHRVRAFESLYAGDPGTAVVEFERAIVALERANDERSACLVRCNLGFAYKGIGHYEKAEEVLRLSLLAAERMGLRDVATAIMHNLGMVLALIGRLSEGQTIEAKAAEECRKQGDARLEGGSRCYLSAMALYANDPKRAEMEAREAARLLEISPPTKVSALAALSRALLAQGRHEEALATASNGMAILDALVRVEEGEASLRLVYAEALFEAGHLERAQAVILHARERLEERAGKIKDERSRRSFLENVIENARTLSLAREWSVRSGAFGTAATVNAERSA